MYNMLVNLLDNIKSRVFDNTMRMKIIHTHCVIGNVDYQHHDFFKRKYKDYIHKFTNVIVSNNNDIYVSSEGSIMFDEIVYPRNISGYLLISGICSICIPYFSMKSFCKNENELCITKEYNVVETFNFDHIKVYYTRNPIQMEQHIFHIQNRKISLLPKKIKIFSKNIPYHSYKFYNRKNRYYGKEIKLNDIITIDDYLPLKNGVSCIEQLEDLKIVLTSEITLGTKGDFLLLIFY